jgi:signal transduction histidine kinase
MTAPDKNPIALTTSPKGDERSTAGLLALEVMHEIRNPLEAIGHLTYLARMEAENPEQVRKYMLMAEEQVATLNRIASQTLGFARVAELPKAIDLVGLAEAALRIHQQTVEAKKIHLIRRLPRRLIASVHSGQILQAVSNLIVNSLDALHEGGSLAMRLRETEGGVHLVIADNGHGIMAEHLERIFEPFFSTKDDAGNGIGLSLTKRIVEDHRGTIRLKSSTRKGRSGTAFRIFLPA